MADADLPCVDNNVNETIPLLPGTDDEDDRTTISSRSSSSTSTSVAQAAKLKRILSEKKLELLRRAKARKMKEELLRLDNEIAAAEDAVELAKIKDRFYGEQLGGAPAVDVANLQDFEGDESPKQSDLKVINTESTTQVVKEQNVADPKLIGVNDEQSMLWKSARNDASVVKVPLSSSTPNQPVMSVLNSKESSLNPPAIAYVQKSVPKQDYLSGDSCFPATATESMVSRLTASIDSIVTRSSLPPLDLVKFPGDLCEYFRFKARFHEMVDSQNISEAQKMSRLLQFLDGQARRAVAGFEGVSGILSKALKMLEQRFGQPHVVTKACVDALVEGPNISSGDRQGREFADRSRTLYETLQSMNALSEMNMTNLAKMAGKLPVALQVNWRDEPQRIREKGGFPSLQELVEFIERRAEAANDPIFGKVGEVNRNFVKRPLKVNKRAPPSDPTAEGGSKATTFATQLESHSQEGSNAQDRGSNVSMSRGTLLAGKCYSCEASHKIEHCPEFTSKSVRQRIVFARYKGLCLNCLRKGHFAGQCKSAFRCKHCQQPHHTLLHRSVNVDTGMGDGGDQAVKEPANVNAVTTAAHVEMPSHTYSTTSRAKIAIQVVPNQILSKEGRSVTTYALLDTGSEKTFLSKSVSEKLGIQIDNCDTLTVCTLSGESAVRVGQVDVEVRSAGNRKSPTVSIKGVKVVDNLKNTATKAKDLSRWPHLKDIVIPEVDETQVTMLIGANVSEVQVHEECRRGQAGEPYAVRAVLGWAVLGPVDATGSLNSQTVNVNFVKYGSELSDQQMEQFLRLEDIDMNKSSKKGMSVEDQESLNKMKNSVRLVNGHYEVGMLWKSEDP